MLRGLVPREMAKNVDCSASQSVTHPFLDGSSEQTNCFGLTYYLVLATTKHKLTYLQYSNLQYSFV